MQRVQKQRGFTLVEALVSLTVLALAMTGLFSLLVHNSRLNKSEQMKAETQANARNVLSIVVAKLRSAGWDPLGTDLFNGLTLDTNTGDTVAEITVRADYHTAGTPGTPDGLADQVDEVIVFRHVNNQILWDNDDDGNFDVLAVNISNDADGDGTIENMFVPDSTTDPQQITVQITAVSPVIDPITRDFSRYTVTSDVFIRKDL
ncbi:MAG: prepilin-type N-terminal cleavage/methylation domain-containing protein [Acidobacteria bacterium]|nr:prepilin-type N-terminal cleavage/methylation domain-containing protein [Acidobacteriota bacterium]NIM62569.1 prepilin-type N-terminal cleavage/methylation domain-containing protein [Acidobacteriota bacterium]NIO58302.1 prepilin-type N-terminal cleavage/methylation domain-containing protein [Acidobacteriota bacterium]NIQ29358.1 prepilin-type N-terminal cleavage/methylation domain-containing protein [Acidobacteriota bacterium]NIQ83958.1 prepilin-type N-terminal cleavage/methylation domain-con